MARGYKKHRCRLRCINDPDMDAFMVFVLNRKNIGVCCYIEHKGKRIASRLPGEEDWKILVPGYSVKGGSAKDGYGEIDLTYLQ